MSWPWIRRTDEQLRNQRQAFRQSIELPVAITVSGLPAAVYATLVNISENGCRLRSLILFERGRTVSFELRRAGHPALQLHGSVVTRTTPLSGGGFQYGITFSSMSSSDRDKLVVEIHEMQRREAAARAERRDPDVPRSDATSKQRRTSVRALAAFPICYRMGGNVARTAQASEVSTGGLRLLAREPLKIGTELELRFTLPDQPLEVYPRAHERTEISPFGLRTVRVPDNRRPFEEMQLQGRVVSRLLSARGREVYGVAFMGIDGYQREEIARFTHAVQLAKLRS